MFIKLVSEYGKDILVNFDNVAEINSSFDNKCKVCMVKDYPDIYVRHSFAELQRIIKRACVKSEKSVTRSKLKAGA